MTSLNKKGFTIVELLIVIVVIGILATLVIVTFTGIQQKGRNSQRQTDINALNSHIEAFYAQSGSYPTIDQLKDSTWRTTNMKGLDPETLVDPKGAVLSDTAAAANEYNYSYVATRSSDSSVCSSTSLANDPGCDTYTLQANLEGGTQPNAYTKKSN
jgi:prepilin-type N-terminal cleavage/methylation domain-containing protein